MKSGPLTLKTVLCENHIDTNATSTTISTKLSNLDDINNFNEHIKILIKSLLAIRYISMDLLENLLKGYKMSLDH